MVGWEEGSNLHIKRWNGTIWELVKTLESSSAGSPNSPSLALDSKGNPVVAYTRTYSKINWRGESILYGSVAVWRSSPIIDSAVLGPISLGDNYVPRFPSVAINANDIAAVSWMESSSQYRQVITSDYNR